MDLSRGLPWTSRLALRLPVAAARSRRSELRGRVPAGVRSWDDAVAASAPLPAGHPLPDVDDTAVLLYTGGTTLADIAEIAFLIRVGAEIFGRRDRFWRRAGFCRGRDGFRGGGWGSCCLRFGRGCRRRDRVGDGVGGRDHKREGDQDERGYGDRGDQDR